jgi:trans-2,3-dihydro-3-hydroxyanthranilate isomerase
MNNRQYRYFICDVFTQSRFGGNPLAVLPDAAGLSTGEMQQIAREFNFSESTFVLAGSEGFTRQVRIFTPTTEVPFAGHPNVGTAFALANDGQFGDFDECIDVRFDELAGAVPVQVHKRAGGFWCELRAPQALTRGAVVEADRVARVLSLPAAEIVTRIHPPQVASVGLPFLLVEVRNLAALQRARIDIAELESLQGDDIVPDIHVYTRSDDEYDLRARMFAPFDGVPEDPATGSANCALAALLASCDAQSDASFSWRIAQGVEMGRPSELQARAEKTAGAVETWIGGYSVLVSEGCLWLD